MVSRAHAGWNDGERRSDRLMLLVVAFACGAACYFALPREPSAVWLLVACGGLAVSAFAGRRLRAGPGLLALFAVLVGVTLAAWAGERAAAPVLERPHGPARVEGRIVTLEAGAIRRRILLGDVVVRGLPAAKTPERIRLRVHAVEGVGVGDRVALRARLLPPSPPAAPGAFDFARKAYFQRLGAVGFALGPVRISEPAIGRPVWSGLRQEIARRIRGVLDPPLSGLAVALTVGDRSGIPEPVYRDLRDAGLAHVMAISGLHMGLVGMFVFALARLLLALPPRLSQEWPMKKLAAVFALLALAGYLQLSGGSASTQRAFVMVGLAFVAVLLDRRVLSLRLLAIAAGVILLLAPQQIVEPGFQMSFAAVGALIAAHGLWRERIAEAWRDAGPGRRLLLYGVGILATTVIASAATAPFAMMHFNRVAAFGLLANLAVIPLVSFWIMPMAVLSCFAMVLGLEALPLWLMGAGLEPMVRIAAEVSAWPAAAFGVPAYREGMLALAAAGLAALILGRRPVRIAGGVVLAASLAFGRAPVPDLWLSPRADLAAARLSDATLSLTSRRSDGFVAQTWLRRAGTQRVAPAARGWRCDRLACVIEVRGQAVVYVRDPRALTEECRQADILLSREPVRGSCPSPRVVLDRFSVWREGAIALYLEEAEPDVRFARQSLGERPWNPYRHRPRWRERWR